jgi:CRISPR-associated DxTHG motif protein
MLVFTTEEAAETTWPVLAALNDPRIQKIDIPIGSDTGELWSLFEKLTEKVAHGDSVIFDITHGLRSIPFLVFLAAIYLKEARAVTIEKILYGAFELGRPAPVIDLSEFVSLLDWLTASNQFIQTGNGRYLAQLLNDVGCFTHPRRALTPDERAAEASAKRIGKAAGAIEQTSQALLTTLIPHAERAAENLGRCLDTAREDLAGRAPPYRLIAERVRDTYVPFALQEPMNDSVEQDLNIQLGIVDWYIDKGHLPQALTLMREWIINAVGYRLSIFPPELLDRNGKRRDVESALNRNSKMWQDGAFSTETPPRLVAEIQTWAQAKELADFWNQVGDLRNFIDHAAMRTHWEQRSIQTVVKQSQDIHAKFQTLSQTLLENSACSS